MKPRITTTNEVRDAAWLKFLFYGKPGAGKTHLASTFPKPLFVIQDGTQGELRTISDTPFTMIAVNKMQEFIDVVSWISEQVEKKNPIGNYVPLTIVIDKWTTFQQFWESEIIDARRREKPNADPYMAKRDWGLMLNVAAHAITFLHRLDCHIVHLADAYEKTVTTKVSGRETSKMVGGVSLVGGAQGMIDSRSNVLAYLEQRSKVSGAEFFAYLRAHEHWNCRCHAPAGMKIPHRIGTVKDRPDEVHPHYNDFANVLGIPLREDLEGDWDPQEVEEKSKKEPKKSKKAKKTRTKN